MIFQDIVTHVAKWLKTACVVLYSTLSNYSKIYIVITL